jgi:hypothetical protein
MCQSSPVAESSGLGQKEKWKKKEQRRVYGEF